MKSNVTWVDAMVPDEDDRCRYLRYKFVNGQLLRQLDVYTGIELTTTYAFQEEEDEVPQLGDEVLRIDYVIVSGIKKSITCSIVTLTQEIIDDTETQSNLAPTDIALSNNTIPTATGIGEVVGILSTFDPNITDTHTYTIISDLDNKFIIDGNNLRLTSLVDFDTSTSHIVIIRSTDQGLLFFEKQFTIFITENVVFLNDKATLFQNGPLNQYMTGPPSSDIITGNGKVTMAHWIKRDVPNPNSITFPDNISDLVLWLDANDNSSFTEVLGKISTWSDKSGNDNHATQNVSTFRPTKNINGYGTRTTLSLDGDDFLETGLDVNVDCTIFTVFAHDHDTTQPAGPVWQTINNVNTSGFFPKWIDGKHYIATTTFISEPSPFVRNQFYNSSVVYDNVTNRTNSYVNGILGLNATNVQVTGLNFTIGKRSADGSHYRGEIAEILVYNKVLTEIERLSIDDYLNKKWNLGLSISNTKTIGSLHRNSSELNTPWTGSNPKPIQWLDASDLTTIDDSLGQVDIWRDKSGSDNHMSSFGSNRPLIISDGGLEASNKSILRFNGSQYLTRNDALGLSGNPEMTVFIVANQNHAINPPVSSRILQIGDSSGAVGTSISMGADFAWRYNNGNSVGVEDFTFQARTVGTFRGGSGSYSPRQHFKDGSLMSEESNAGSSNIPNITNEQFSIGSGWGVGGAINQTFTGDVYEVLVFSEEISDTLRSEIEIYLEDKWGNGINDVTLPQDPKLEILWNENNIISLDYYNTNTNNLERLSYTSTPTLADGEYHLLTAEYDSINFEVHIGLDGTRVNTATSVVLPTTGDFPASIASRTGVLGLEVFYKGLMDEVSWWTDLINITELYNSGFAQNLLTHSGVSKLRLWLRMGDSPDDFIAVQGIKDRSGQSNHFTIKNASISNCVNDSVPLDPGYDNTLSLPFNGVDQYGDTGIVNGFTVGDSSISLWYKGTSPDYVLSQARIISSYSSNFIIAGGGALFWVRTQTLGSIASISDNQWHHLTMSWDDTTKTYDGYLDGVNIGTSGVVTTLASTGNIALCTRGDFSTAFSQGNIDELSFWDKTLTDVEVLEIYNAGVPSNLNSHSASANVTNWWRMGDDPLDDDITLKDQKGSSDIILSNFLPSPYDPETPS